MVELIASPYLGYRSAVEQAAVLAVVGRMDVHEDASPELALAVLEDTALVKEVSEAGEEELREVVHRAYSEKAKDLEARAVASAELAVQERQAREEAEEHRALMEADLDAERQRREARDSDLLHERAQAEAREKLMLEQLAEEAEKRKEGERLAAERERVAREQLRDEKADRERVELERKQTEEGRIARRGRTRRRTAAALLALLTIGTVVALLLTHVVAGTLAIVFLTAGASIILAAAGYLAFSQAGMNAVVGVVSLASGFAGLALALLTAD